MSRKENCLDNAPIESFFGHLKDDVDIKSCETFEEVKYLVENYIFYYTFDSVSCAEIHKIDRSLEPFALYRERELYALTVLIGQRLAAI